MERRSVRNLVRQPCLAGQRNTWGDVSTAGQKGHVEGKAGVYFASRDLVGSQSMSHFVVNLIIGRGKEERTLLKLLQLKSAKIEGG